MEGAASTEAKFTFGFRGLSEQELADFVTTLKLIPTNDSSKKVYEAVFTVQYSKVVSESRLKVRKWVGYHDENPLTAEMLEELRAVYLPPLRDPASGLRPGRFSQLAKLLHRLANQSERDTLEAQLKKIDSRLKLLAPVSTTNSVIGDKHTTMLGKELAQLLDLELSPSDFSRFAARLGISVAGMEVEQNGLGFNNLIFMAVVLSELGLNKSASYCGLIVEEPEAHLHPQLQSVLLDYLKTVEMPQEGQRPVQVFVTSHSPNFAALADLDSICCIYDSPTGPAAFSPRDIKFDIGQKEKLQRYLNVTRAELFFARRLILVEGTAELFLVDALASNHDYDLRKHSVSIISTDGLNFDCFLPLFGENAMQIPVAVITDADPPKDIFPRKFDEITISPTGSKLRKSEDKFVRLFFAKKTLEYDLALYPSARKIMLLALDSIHPTICKSIDAEIKGFSQSHERAKIVFSKMYITGSVQKGRFAQLFAFEINKSSKKISLPPYLLNALNFAVTTIPFNEGEDADDEEGGDDAF
jgi:putative ATP-dependent endonuclease of OLD family